MEMHETEAQNDDLPQIFAVGQPVDGQHTFNRRDFLKAAAAATVAGAALAACNSPKKVDPPAATLSPDEIQNACITLYAHDAEISTYAVSPDGRYLATASRSDIKIKVWTLPSGELLKTLDNKKTVLQVFFTPDSSLLLSESDDEVNTWTLPDGKSHKTLKGHDSQISRLVLSPDGTRLASVEITGEIRVWSLPDGEHMATLPDQGQTLSRLAFAPDNVTLVVLYGEGESRGDVRLFSRHDGTPITLPNDAGEVLTMAYAVSPDSRTLAIAYASGVIRLWSLPDGVLQTTLESLTGAVINALAFSPDGSRLLAGGGFRNSSNGLIWWWAMPNPEGEPSAAPSPNGTVVWMEFSADATRLMTQVNRVQFTLWHFPEMRLIGSISQNNGIAALAPDFTFYTHLYQRSIQVYSLPEEVFITCFADMEANSEDDAGVEIEVEGRTYTQPCGAPIPAGATCTCNCVAGGLCSCVGHRSSGSRGGSSSYWYPN